jgi:hypothetical protein
MKIRSVENLGRAGVHHHGHLRQHRHHRRTHWLTRLVPNVFTTVIAPLAVGLALQFSRGCDPPRPAPETALVVPHPAHPPSAQPVSPDHPASHAHLRP